ncbi:1092_t:CDS:1, partial [Gigaspora rosea]
IPGNNQANSPANKLQYMKDVYQDIYKAENNDSTIAEFFVQGLPQLSPLQNQRLV